MEKDSLRKSNVNFANCFDLQDIRVIKHALIDEIKQQVVEGPTIFKDGKLVDPKSSESDEWDYEIFESQNKNIICASIALAKLVTQEKITFK